MERTLLFSRLVLSCQKGAKQTWKLQKGLISMPTVEENHRTRIMMYCTVPIAAHQTPNTCPKYSCFVLSLFPFCTYGTLPLAISSCFLALNYRSSFTSLLCGGTQKRKECVCSVVKAAARSLFLLLWMFTLHLSPPFFLSG